MPQKSSYIPLLNAFHENHSERVYGPAAEFYMYILHRINRNRWNPVFMSDKEIAEARHLSRNHMSKYRELLVSEGLILFVKIGFGRNAGIYYGLPGICAPESAVNCTQKCTLEKESAPESAVNCTQKCTLAAPTPYNRYNKTYKTSSSTISACAHNDGGGDVEIEAVKVEEVEATKTEAEKYRRKQAKAASQGTEVMATFFDSNNHAAIERLCMNNHITPDHLRDTARQIVDDWTQEGTCHDDPGGNFNLSDAIRHLRLTIPHRLAAQQRQNNRAAPASRQENRQRLMEAARDNLNRAIANQHRPPAEPAPPF